MKEERMKKELFTWFVYESYFFLLKGKDPLNESLSKLEIVWVRNVSGI